MMENKQPQIKNASEIPYKSVAELLEEIRLTSLNLAIASAKFKSYSVRQDYIKKNLSDVITLSLESVQQLTKFLEIIGLKSGSDTVLENVDHQKLEKNLSKIIECVREITSGFLKERGLE